MGPDAILALACLVGSPPRPLLPHEAEEIARVVRAESGGNPLAINVNGPGGGRIRVSGLRQAVDAVARLRAAGRSVDVGLAQVNLAAHPTAFPDLAAAFDPRANVCAGARIYVDGAARAARCAYNTGRLACANGYPERVERAAGAAAARRTVRVAVAEPADPAPAPAPETASWDTWAVPLPGQEPAPETPEGEDGAPSPGERQRAVAEDE